MRRLKSFTLVELLVVITIIGIISGLVVVSFNSSRVKARDNKRISDANLIASALSQYYTTNLRMYPLGTSGGTTAYSIIQINSGSASIPFNNSLSNYLNPVPYDPSDSTTYGYYYVYRNDGKKAAIVVKQLEAGTSKCNIPQAAATATATASATATATNQLPDAVSKFILVKGSACYYVAL